MSRLNFKGKKMFIDDQPFYLISGDIHYFRSYRGGLERRLKYAKAFGLTAVQTYVPWNLHEPQSGEYCFDGLCDLKGFLELCDKYGLKVLLRPAAYICSEWDCGGLPYWLLKEEMTVRSRDEKFMKYVERYYEHLVPEFLPYLSTNGGPVIAVAVENEYGSYGNDTVYLEKTMEILKKLGVDVPFYTTDGYQANMINYGTIDGVWAGANYRIESKQALDELRAFQPDKPALIGEYWSGRAIYWGEEFSKRNVDDVVNGFKEALENGGYVNFYMFAGGTNFGFMNGANFGKTFGAAPERPVRYIAHTTTYDEDSLLNELGMPTEKYHACRKVLHDFLGKEMPPMPIEQEVAQTVKPVKFTERCVIWDAIDYSKAFKSAAPLTMEKMGQDYGFALYRTEFVGCGEKMRLSIDNLRDRADVYVDRAYAGTLMREHDELSVELEIPKGKKVCIELLVENLGRINYGPLITEKKGIDGGVFLDHVQLFGWESLPLDLKSLDFVKYRKFEKTDAPVFLRAEFEAEAGKDTFLDMSKMNKGVVFVNGFNLGRYWNVGPQLTLYLPEEVVKKNNVIEVFDLYGADEHSSVEGIETPVIREQK